MRFARIVYWIAAVYGIAVIFPMFFMEESVATQYHPAITHAEYFYGFAGVTLVWQFVFVLIALHPERYRAMIGLSIVEKLALVPGFLILSPQGRYPPLWVPALIIDLVLGVLFTIAFIKTRTRNLRPDKE